MTILTTPRLTIRPLTAQDLPALVAYRNDPDVARYQGWPLPSTLEQEQQLISSSNLGTAGWVQRALVTHAGELIGDVGLNTHHQQAELGITLARHAWGHGYAHETLTALLNHVFHDLSLHRVHAGIDPRNESVGRLLTRLGFRLEGTHVQSYWHRGQWTDEAVYALLREEWEKNKEKV